MFHVPEPLRLKTGLLSSEKYEGNNGVFIIQAKRYEIAAIASDGAGWEHVSVTLSNNRMPNWKEMASVKSLFWDAEDAVMQLHPPESTYINNHPQCLHLWRPIGDTILLPPEILIGIKGLNVG